MWFYFFFDELGGIFLVVDFVDDVINGVDFDGVMVLVFFFGVDLTGVVVFVVSFLLEIVVVLVLSFIVLVVEVALVFIFLLLLEELVDNDDEVEE